MSFGNALSQRNSDPTQRGYCRLRNRCELQTVLENVRVQFSQKSLVIVVAHVYRVASERQSLTPHAQSNKDRIPANPSPFAFLNPVSSIEVKFFSRSSDIVLGIKIEEYPMSA